MATASQRVMITEESNLKTQADVDCRPTFCQLRNPNSGKATMFMFTDGGRRVHEVMSFDEDGRRSWFIDNTIVSGGSLLVTTPVDAVFLVLPYLIQASKTGKFMSVDCLLVDSDWPECRRLASCCTANQLGATIADVKDCGSDGSTVLRYNKEKTMSWLKQKVEVLVCTLRQQEVNVDNSIATFVKSKRSSESANDANYVQYACGMISEYLSADLSQQLSDFLGLKADLSTATYADDDNSPLLKKAKVDVLTPIEDYSIHGAAALANKKEKLTNAQKQLGKVDKKGIKSISSFFTAKTATKLV